MSIFTLAFLAIIDLSFEAAIVGFVIPSQILSSVRTAQVQMSQALVNHILPVKNLIIKEDKKDLFSASHYVYASYLVAREVKYLPEASLILSFIDPYPHVEFTSIIDELKRLTGNGSGSDIRTTITNAHILDVTNTSNVKFKFQTD